MQWQEIKITTRPEALEPLTGFLMARGVNNVRIVDDAEMERFLIDHPLSWDYKEERKIYETYILFYVEKMDLAALERDLTTLAAEIDLGEWSISSGNVDEDDWLHEWKKTYKPFKIGNVVVKPVWEEYAATADEIIFTIDPGSVFGTGLHETTQLCVTILCENTKNISNCTVLDVGCGSGILGIIALLLGAKAVDACDLDANAVRIAEENAKLNKVENYSVFTGELANAPHKKYDIIVANIVADVLIGFMPLIPNYLSKTGQFIMSGIIDERLTDVHSALQAHNLIVVSEKNLNGWFALTAKTA
ncbi:MAG: 50S ribosomal protein L11 methyltransferase [Turicibacter sp.]|nr:50S ribosomal protein L11 methyltransferase [Turicibacter sp.]